MKVRINVMLEVESATGMEETLASAKTATQAIRKDLDAQLGDAINITDIRANCVTQKD
jgi:hypothetical protein